MRVIGIREALERAGYPKEAIESYLLRINAHEEMLATLKTVRKSCKEALSNEWDRSDEGFQSMIENCDEAIAKAGL